jgi:hypothetical protein
MIGGKMQLLFQKNYEITKGKYGLRMTLLSPWSEKVEKAIKRKGVVELYLNEALGWKSGNDLSFLRRLRELLTFELLDWNIKDVSDIHSLSNLKALHVDTYCDSEIDFSCFPQLEDVGLEWRTEAKSLFDCTTLKKVFINCCEIEDLSSFSKMQHLKSLCLKSPSISAIGDVSNLKNLRYLELGNAKNLTSLDGIEKLSNLEDLRFYICRKMRNIEPLRSLTKLKRLYLCNCGPIESLKPLGCLKSLEDIYFCESTKILDGDLYPLKELPNLKEVYFPDRKNYNLKLYDFNPKEAKALEKLLKKYSK